jgi:hypothetical protein
MGCEDVVYLLFWKDWSFLLQKFEAVWWRWMRQALSTYKYSPTTKKKKIICNIRSAYFFYNDLLVTALWIPLSKDWLCNVKYGVCACLSPYWIRNVNTPDKPRYSSSRYLASALSLHYRYRYGSRMKYWHGKQI